MKKLYSYIIKSYIGPFVATFFIALFILLMQFLWKYIDDLVGKGFDWGIIARLLFFASSTFVPMAVPLAVLLSSLMSFGNLGERYELVALKAAGISLRSVMKPMAVFIAILSIVAFLFSNNIMPVANLKMRTLLHDVRKQKPAVSIQPGVFYDEIENYTIKIGGKDNDGKTIRDVVIYDHTKKQGNVSVTVADSGTMQVTKDKRFLVFQLFNGKNYMERIEKHSEKYSRPLQITKFREELRRIDLASFSFEQTNEEFYKNHYEMMNLTQLVSSKDSILEHVSKRKNDYSTSQINHFSYYNSLIKQSSTEGITGKKADSAKALTANSGKAKQAQSGPGSAGNTSDTLRESAVKPEHDSITYAVLSNMFPPELLITESGADNNRQANTLREHNIRRRMKAQQKEQLEPGTLSLRGRKQLSKGYTIHGLRKKAKEIGLDLDSLMKNDPDFPTIITSDTELDRDLLENFKPGERAKIVEYAINDVRNIISRTDYTTNVLRHKRELIARHDIEWHRKFTLSFACIVLFFIGAPLGALIRKGGFGFPVVVSVLLFVIYHVISMTGEKFAREGVIEPWWGMWISALVLLPLGIFLTLKATTDAPFLNSETYLRLFRKLRNQFFRRD